MSEHAWARDRLERYVAGESNPTDVERLEAHTRNCPECAEAFEIRQLGIGLHGLFAEIRPNPVLEQRVILASAAMPKARTSWRPTQQGWLGIAVIFALGLIGVIALEEPDLRFAKAPQQAFSFVGSNIATGDPRSSDSYQAKSPPAVRSDNSANAPFAPSGPPAEPSVEAKDSSREPSSPVAINGAVGNALPQQLVPSPPGGIGGPASGIGGYGGGAFGGVGGGDAITVKPGSTNLWYNPGSQPGGVPAPPASQPNKDGSNANQFRPNDFKPSATAGKPQAEEPKQVPSTQTPPKVEPGATPPKDAAATASPEPIRRIVIRSGEVEFEIDSFDAATAAITKLVADIKGAFIATVNSEKQPNGKVKGSITVRTPPEHLDSLVLDLRKELGKGGELKGIRISSQDVTKQYTDLESRLRGARTMEARLIEMIKEGKGEIKQLLEAERELGVWRTKIEEFEGELRYYANLAALSTLTITLLEKEARTPIAVTEIERVQAGVEVEDVDKAYRQFLADIAEAKGRVSKSELKQYAAGQFNATVTFEVAPDAAGPLRDKLRQLGHVARLEIDRGLHTESGPIPADAKPKRGDTLFQVQIYNLANVAPRETIALQLAAADVAISYQTLRDAVTKATGRIATSSLNEQDKQNVVAQLDFEVRRPNEASVRDALDKAGEAISRQVARAPEGDSVTDTKVMLRVSLIGASRVKARETKILQLAALDVPTAYRSLREAIAKTSGRIVAAQLNEQDRQNVTATFEFEIRRADVDAVESALDSAGEVVSRQVLRSPEGETASDAKVRYQMTFSASSKLKARETTTLTVEVADVEQATAVFAMQVAKANGRQLAGQSTRESSGKTTARLSYEVPLAAAASVVDGFKGAGAIRSYQMIADPLAPNGKFATAKLDVTLANSEGIVAADDGLWPQVKRGLTYSATALLKSVTWVIFGACVVLPWAAIGFIAYRLLRRAMPSSPPVAGAGWDVPPSASTGGSTAE